MLPDEEIEKLCHGRLIYAPVYRSDGKDAAGPHWAVMLDSDEEIKTNKPEEYYVVVISHDEEIDPFRIPVPPRTGLTGFIQCSWRVVVALPAIIEIGQELLAPEMLKVLEKIREACAAQGRQSRRSTHS